MDDIVNKSFGSKATDCNSGVQKMVYGISHDMSAPLRAVVQLSQMLKKRVGDKLDEKEMHWLQLVENSGIHAQKMIEALLVFSRLSTHGEPDCSFPLKRAIEKTIAEHDNQIQVVSADIKTEGDWPEITGCEQRWLQYFNCLISNALLYQPKDSNHKPQVIIRCEQHDNHLHISVEDNGIGVQENLWPVLTTPFKRMQSEEDYAGIGMGLTYCERIAELNGGDLTIGLSPLGGLLVTHRYPEISAS